MSRRTLEVELMREKRGKSGGTHQVDRKLTAPTESTLSRLSVCSPCNVDELRRSSTTAIRPLRTNLRQFSVVLCCVSTLSLCNSVILFLESASTLRNLTPSSPKKFEDRDVSEVALSLPYFFTQLLASLLLLPSTRASR